jgi:hypothetical protein
VAERECAKLPVAASEEDISADQAFEAFAEAMKDG